MVAVPDFVRPPVPPSPVMLPANVPLTLLSVVPTALPAANESGVEIVPVTFVKLIGPAAEPMTAWPVPSPVAASTLTVPVPSWKNVPLKVLVDVVLESVRLAPPFFWMAPAPDTEPVIVIAAPASVLRLSVPLTATGPASVKATLLPDWIVALPVTVNGSGIGAELALDSR